MPAERMGADGGRDHRALLHLDALEEQVRAEDRRNEGRQGN